MTSHLRKSDWVVVPAPITDAAELVRTCHYAGGAPNTGVYIHGLYHVDYPDEIMGVAWWLPPMITSARYVEKETGISANRVIGLSRLVIHPGVPTNGASYLLGQSERIIRHDGRYLAGITYADTFRGHTGAIYLATNWEYTGETAPKPIWIDPRTGMTISQKQAGKTRRTKEMQDLGYMLLGRARKHRFIKVF